MGLFRFRPRVQGQRRNRRHRRDKRDALLPDMINVRESHALTDKGHDVRLWLWISLLSFRIGQTMKEFKDQSHDWRISYIFILSHLSFSFTFALYLSIAFTHTYKQSFALFISLALPFLSIYIHFSLSYPILYPPVHYKVLFDVKDYCLNRWGNQLCDFKVDVYWQE